MLKASKQKLNSKHVPITYTLWRTKVERQFKPYFLLIYFSARNCFSRIINI